MISIVNYLQLQEVESLKKKDFAQNAQEMATLRKENDELKEVLSVVQIDLESKTEVQIRC